MARGGLLFKISRFLVLGFATLSPLRKIDMQNQNQSTQNQIIANDSENHYQPVGGFLPSLNKQGKVTATAQKRAVLLNALDKKGIQALAINGKGKLAKDAAASLQVDSLASLLASPKDLTGGQIATLRAMIIASYGESLFNRESHKGLGGLVDYLALVAKKLEVDVAVAETATTQQRIISKLATVRAETAAIQRLLDLRDMAIAASGAIATTAPKKATTAPKKATT